MQEIQIRHTIKVDQDAESDFHKLYEDSCAKYYDEGEII